MLKRVLPACWLAWAASACALDIVRDGKPVSEIIVAAGAHEGTRRAAEDLQYFIGQMSGAQLQITNAPTDGIKNRIYVGESEFTQKIGYELPKFNNSGYDILVKSNYAVLAGPLTTAAPSPFAATPGDNQYMNPASKMEKPKDFPSPGLQKWWDYTGEKFGLDHVENGGGGFNHQLKIWQNDDIGPWHAVSALLEELGVRFYAPYEDGTVVPERKTIVLPDQHSTKEAAFGRRHWYYGVGPASADKDGVAWLKRVKGGCRTMIIFNHTTYGVYANRLQHELHPEYLAEEAPGKKYQGYPAGRGMPRYTEPDFRRACLAWLRKVFNAFPNLSAASMGCPDGGILLDYRDRDEWMEGGKTMRQAASDYTWDFNVYLAKELKKSHPGKRLIYFAHQTCNLPPTNMKEDDPDNIIFPFTDPHSANRVLKHVDNAFVSNNSHLVTLQIKNGVKGPVWDYFLYYRHPHSPRYPVFFWESLQREMKEMLPYADGKFVEHCPDSQSSGMKGPRGARIGTVPIIHLMMYIQMKLFWDPGLDMRALLDEYYRLYFGPAAKEMKEFHEYAHEVWNRQESRSVTETTGFLKERDVDKYFDLLAQAKARTDKDSAFYRRIDAMEKGYESLKKLFPGLKRTGPFIHAYTIPSDTALDGDLSKYKHCPWYSMVANGTGETVARNATRAVISLTENRKYLFVGAVCYESRMNSIIAGCNKNDDFSIFEDDVVEIYLDSPERSYFKIALNTNGAIWDESQDVAVIARDTLPNLWNPGVKAAVKKYEDRWEAEIKIPVEDLGQLGPTQEFPWGILVGRTRMLGGGPANHVGYSITPTGGGYATLPKWGKLWVQ